ncbi:MAG TPA: ABC transporter ATP-binding protein [Erythrobacter sp.]|nr:ABC transporter ATP-binding protein [Erythrobacter sp.]
MDDQEHVSAAACRGNMASLRKVLAASAPRKGLIAAGIAVGLFDVVATVAFPLIARQLVDSMGDASFSLTALMASPIALALFGLLALGAVASGISGYLLSKAGMLIARQLKGELFARLLRRPVGYFDRTESGELVSRFANDTRNISGLVTKSLAGIFEGALVLVGSAVLLIMLDVPLTLMIFGVILGTFAIMAPVLIKTAKFTERINDQNARFGSLLTRVFGEIRLVKAFNAEPVEERRTRDQLGTIYQENLRISRIEALISPMNGLALTIAMLIIFGYGGLRVAQGTLTIGTLTAFILTIFNIVAPIIQFSMIFNQYQSALGSSAVLAEMLDETLEEPDTGTAAPGLAAGENAITFDGVRFGYEGASGDGEPGAAALFNFDGVAIALGKRTAIVGPSGGGKSTLFALIERFYTPQTGRILYRGRDIAGFDLLQWRSMIGVVPQGSNLFAGSVLDNIAYGDPNPCAERAWRAAQSANCGDFLSGPDSLLREVGEGGVLLSGGQKQRIAIARMFYRDPQILLLDEATSALDASNEDSVLSALEQLMAGRTTLAITHRVASLDRFDHVLAIEHGRLRPVPMHGGDEAAATPMLRQLAKEVVL